MRLSDNYQEIKFQLRKRDERPNRRNTHSGEHRGPSEVLSFIPLTAHPLNNNRFVPGHANGAAGTISPTPPLSIDFLLHPVPYFLVCKHNWLKID